MRLGFGDCLFDSATRELARSGRPLELSPKAYLLLSALIAHRPRAMSKAELHEIVWPGTFVSDSSLARLVSELRAAIDDRRDERHLIRTVHGFGYAFSGEVEELAPSAPGVCNCWLAWKRRMIPLNEGENLLGRDPDSVVAIDSAKVSRRHSRIVVAGAGATLEDLGSKNGTYLEGRRIDDPIALKDGDQICVGSVILTFRRSDGGLSTETELSRLDP